MLLISDKVKWTHLVKMSASLFSSKGAGDPASAGCHLSSLSVGSWGPGAKSGSQSRAFSGLLGDTFRQVLLEEAWPKRAWRSKERERG